jgi:folate-binding protein YgfZ
VDYEPGEFYPLELNLYCAIDYNKGCYIGQEVISRATHQGVVRKGVYALKYCNERMDGQTNAAAERADIYFAGEKIGVMLCKQARDTSFLALLNIEKAEEAKDQYADLMLGAERVKICA